MAATGLFFLPLEANAQSQFTTLSQHIARRSSTEPLPPFWLDYRLLVNTSSLLPGSLEIRKRRSTHVLTLSQFPDRAYVLTEPIENNKPASIITIPSGGAASSFLTMVTAKMQPLWAARHELKVEKGTSVELTEGLVSTIRVGELRVTVGPGVGRTRGVIIAITMRGDDVDELGDANAEDQEKVLRLALDAVFRGSGIDLASAKLVHKRAEKQSNDPENASMIRLYTDLMRVAAPTAQR